MRINKIDFTKLYDKEFISSLNLQYSLEYYNDKVAVNKVFKGIVTEGLIEGRYFNKESELRIYKVNGEYRVTLFNEEENDKILKVEHLLIDNKFEGVEKIGIKKYIDYDNDGQAFIKCLRKYKLI